MSKENDAIMIQKIIRMTLFLMLVLSLFPGSYALGNAQREIDAMFNDANSFYKIEEYSKALNLYLRLDKAGVKNADLYYNIANTYLNVSPPKIGKAILYYNRALHYKNGDAEIIENLNYARSLVVSNDYGRVSNSNDALIFKIFDFFYNIFTINTLTIFMIILLTGVSLSIITYFLLLKKNKLTLRIGVIISILLLIVLIVLFIRLHFEVNIDYGVVINNNSNVYSAPSDKQQILFTLSEGIEAEIKDTLSGGWTLIELPNGVKGYIKSVNIEQIKNF